MHVVYSCIRVVLSLTDTILAQRGAFVKYCFTNETRFSVNFWENIEKVIAVGAKFETV
jgi:hypothetical protein